MARYRFRTNPNDSTVRSISPDYGTAREGSSTLANDISGTLNGAGQLFDGFNFILRQGFMQFDFTTVPTTELCTNAAIVFEGFEHLPTGDPWSLDLREYDFGTTVEDNEWIPGRNITNTALNAIASYPEIRTKRPAPAHWRSSSNFLRQRLSSAGPLKVIAYSNKLSLGWLPGPLNRSVRDEYVHWGNHEGGENFYRPRLDYQTTRLSSLTRVHQASVQLTDGTQVWLEVDGTNIRLKHNPSALTFNTISTLSLGTATNQFRLVDGAQALSLTRDPSDNLYVIGPNGSIANGLTMQAFVKSAGYSWVAKTPISGFLPDYDGAINNISTSFHNQAGGWVVAAVGHATGSSFANQLVLASLSCGNARNGTGAAVIYTTDVTTSRLGAPVNPSGNGLDITALTAEEGVLATVATDGSLSGEADAYARAYRFRIDSLGRFSLNPTPGFSGIFNQVIDGDNHVKIMPISASRFTVFWYGFLRTFTLSGTTALQTSGSIDLPAQGMVTMAQSRVQPWDAVYDPASGKVWAFYLDTANPRRLLRTGYNPNTNLADRSEIEVATNLGASGSTHLAVRLPRGVVDERRFLIHLGNRSATSVLSLVTVAHTGLNQAPTTPVLNPPGVFSAAVSRPFSWLFSDPNPADRQTAYEVQIRNASTLASAFASGKVISSVSGLTLPANTLSNNVNYEWRARVYDSSDTVSPFSAYQAFSTTTAGTATIVDPAVDNQPGLASPSLTVTWTFTGNDPQASYRVRVVRTDTGLQVFDSGYLAGPAVRSYTVTGLLSDVQQRIEVLIRDTATNVSNTATRLVTPSFGAPDKPTIEAQPTESGYGVLIQVSNPPPTGDLPPAGRNDIYRAPTGTDEYVKIGEAFPGISFVDYTGASGVVYDYKAAAVADGETFSDPITGISAFFKGVSLHLPQDPESSFRAFPYGGASNSDDLSSEGTELRFVGRAFPMMEFGTTQSHAAGVSILVPFGETHVQDVEYLREVVRSRTTWCYRDGRGRLFFGVAAQLSVSDLPHGSRVEFSFIRVDYPEGEAA